MQLEMSDGTKVTLTPEQARILLVACDADERGRIVRLVHTTGPRPIRETTTAAALVRKGLLTIEADRIPVPTVEGLWQGDTLRILDRLGKIPARRDPWV